MVRRKLEQKAGKQKSIPKKEQKEVRQQMKTLFLMAFIAAMLIALGVLT